MSVAVVVVVPTKHTCSWFTWAEAYWSTFVGLVLVSTRNMNFGFKIFFFINRNIKSLPIFKWYCITVWLFLIKSQPCLVLTIMCHIKWCKKVWQGCLHMAGQVWVSVCLPSILITCMLVWFSLLSLFIPKTVLLVGLSSKLKLELSCAKLRPASAKHQLAFG